MSSAVTLAPSLVAEQVLEQDAQRVRQSGRVVDHGVEAVDVVVAVPDRRRAGRRSYRESRREPTPVFGGGGSSAPAG